NQASGPGTHKLAWENFSEGASAKPFTDLDLPHLAIKQATDLHLAGTVEVTLADVFTATASGSVDLGQLGLASDHAIATAAGIDDATGAAPIQATVVSLQTSGSGGAVSASVSVSLVSISQGANSWLGVDATGINLSLALDPLTVSVTGGELKLNQA